ncbi:MtrAB system histidine kinase MtrB [Leucobacter sp. GX24907]
MALRWSLLTQPVFGPFRELWQRSLMVRTMVLTGLITTAMVLISGVAILTTIGSDLYDARRDQALDDSARATVAAQRQIDAADTSDRGNLSTLFASVRRTVQDTSASQMIYVRRQPGQLAMSEAPLSYTTAPGLVEALSPELASSAVDAELPQYWQAVAFGEDTGEPGPGIVVASQLTFPSGAGNYDLFIGYSLSDTQESLGSIQRTLGVTAVVLLSFVVILVLTMVRLVFRPIRAAAAASRRLAAGESDARMPLQNDEHFDLLSENFNLMAETLQSRIEELDELSEMQQHFVSDVSHELRTPLTTIRLASEVLRGSQEQLQPAQARAVEVLGAQIERFETLLTDLLEISRYDAGRVTLETEPTNLVTLTQEVVDGLRPVSESPIEVRTLGGYAPLEVDARRIRRIISNLVGNAIEHGEGGPILVTVDSNSAAIAIAVRDWGVGMTAESATRVFDRFWRADPSRKRTLGGTGLGLAIAREDAAVHGGHLEVWSRPGEGSSFRLTLPRGESSASFVSPIPLVPEDVDSDDPDEMSGGWLWRPKRRVRKEGSR